MNDETVHPQPTMFSGNWQAWLVLRHFLPARLQRALVHAIVREASRGKITVEDLVEEIYVDQPIWNESWIVRPRAGAGGYAGYLQMWVRYIVWQHDGGDFGEIDEEKDGEYLSRAFLDAVTRLSVADFGWPADAVDKLIDGFDTERQPSLQSLLLAFKTAQRDRRTVESSAFWEGIAATVEPVDMPLRAMMIKHIADLCADADAWRHARDGYARVESLLEAWTPPAELGDVAMAWKSIAVQCRACALGVVEPRAEVAKIFGERLATATLGSAPVLAANAGLDAVNAQSWIEDGNFKDYQIAQLSSPLLHASHDASYALGHWLRGKHQDASRGFWSLLRRQIALGAATELRATKEWYARSLLDQITEKLDQQDSPRSFTMAVRLLIEAERAESVERIDWKRSLVDTYVVKQELIDELVAHAGAYEGARMRRTKVLIELFKTWAVKLTPSRAALASTMWRHLAKIARDFKAAFESRIDVGRPALKALQELGKKRPELRGGVAADVAEAICQKLREEFHWGQAEAIEAALPYADAFDAHSLRGVVATVLEVLDAEDPAKGFWPLTNPALRFLVDPDVRKRLRDDDALNRRCLEQIFRFGLAEGSQKMRLFFHLADFDEKLLTDEAVRSKMSEPLEHVRREAVKINASNVTDNIRALLVSPFLAGFEGIRDALEGLVRILNSAKAERSSMGLPHVDDPLLLLTQRLDTIRAALTEQEDWLESRLGEVADRLADVWELAAKKPVLFAPFALPPRTKPSDALVHNCAFASLRFAQAVGRESQISEALWKASENPALKSAILLARATNASGEKFTQADIGDAQDDDRDSFYKAIGRRLTQLQRLPQEDAKELCARLVEKCLRFGPHPADAALLLSAANLGLHDHVRRSGWRAYTKRIEEDLDNRLLLLPMTDLFWTKEMNDAPE